MDVQNAPVNPNPAGATTAKPAANPAAATSGGVPTLVKVISILYYIGAGLTVLMALGALLGGSAFASLVPGGGIIFILVGIFLLGLAVLMVFVGIYLWKGRSWARIAAIVLSCLGILGALNSFWGGAYVSGVFSLAINGAIGGYLLLSSEVKAAFS